MAGDQINFILNEFLSNDIRSQAEEAYNNISPATKALYLVRAIQNPEVSEEGRQTAAVLLRQLFTEHFVFFLELSLEEQRKFKEQLLLTIQMDLTQPLRRKVCDVVSELASRHLDDDGANQWPEFLQFMFTCANAQDSNMKEAGLRMLTSVPGVFVNLQNQNLDAMKMTLWTAFQPTESEAIRLQAVKAVGAFLLLHREEPDLSDLIEPMMRVVFQSMEKAEDDSALKVLIELADSANECTIQGDMFQPHLKNISQAAIKMVGDKDQEDSWRQLALEVMVTLCETAPTMVHFHVPMAVRVLTPLVLEMMCEIEDEAEWATEDEGPYDDNENNNVVAESALYRMCHGLGGKDILDLIVGSVPVMLQSEDWRRRHAALMAVSSASGGCQYHKRKLDQIIPAVLDYLADPHPRVRYAACNAVGRMSSDFAPIFEDNFHDKVVPRLFSVLDDNANPRVQAHAAAALGKFSENCPKPILNLYLDPLMNKLEVILTAKFKELIEHGRKHVLEQIMTTIASIADTVEKDFIPYYDRFMACLKYIIANATTAELKMLRGKTIECVSLIVLAVGEDKSLADASEVMELLPPSADDLTRKDVGASFLISIWSRLCTIMGKNFAQYLPMVMGPVIRTAAVKPQQTFGINTPDLSDKASACGMLVCCARELKEAFVEYAEDVVKLMVPMLKFNFHDEVRRAAAESLPYLLECARIRGHRYIEGMWAYILPELLKAIDSEQEQKVKLQLLNSLKKCIELLGNGCLNDQTMAEVLRILNKLLTEHFERTAERRPRRADEDYDDDDADEDNEDEDGLSGVRDVLHALLSTYREFFFPYLDTLLPHLVALIHPSRPDSDREDAIYIFTYVIEFGGPACVKYQDIFLVPMLNGLCCLDSKLRQAAAYGCGVLAQFGGPRFADACARAVPQLAAVVQEPNARSLFKVDATEDAITAVTKIIKYNNSKINREETIRHWLTWLPVVKNREEAQLVYSLLCELAAGGHPALAAPDAPRRVVAVLAEAFQRQAVPEDSDVFSQMIALIRQIQSNAQLFNSCLMQLSKEQKEALLRALSQVA